MKTSQVSISPKVVSVKWWLLSGDKINFDTYFSCRINLNVYKNIQGWGSELSIPVGLFAFNFHVFKLHRAQVFLSGSAVANLYFSLSSIVPPGK